MQLDTAPNRPSCHPLSLLATTYGESAKDVALNFNKYILFYAALALPQCSITLFSYKAIVCWLQLVALVFASNGKDEGLLTIKV